MALVAGLVPGAKWLGGGADVRLTARGPAAAPLLSGAARLARGGLALPFLKAPATGIDADVTLADGTLRVRGLAARVGRKGRVDARGELPLTAAAAAAAPAGDAGMLMVELEGVDVRARPAYSGLVDASLTLSRERGARAGAGAAALVLGGDVRLSRGTLSLLPQDGVADGSPAGAAVADVLRASAVAARAPPPPVRTSSRDSPLPPLTLRALDVRLGPELRAVYPFVVNVGLSGDLRLAGAPATPGDLRLAGAVTLDGGEVNLLATQLVLDREHANRVVFDGGPGADPSLDLALRGAGVRAAVVGRASAWRQGLTLTTGAGGAAAGGGGGAGAPELASEDAARLFEAALARAVVADDGRLALPALAAAAAHGFMPKIQTQGALGSARWRLVSAPAVPGLLDPGSRVGLLETIAAGTEVEVQFGRSLRAALARPLRDAERGPPAYTLTYGLTSRLRVQFSVGAGGGGPRALVFQYSSDA